MTKARREEIKQDLLVTKKQMVRVTTKKSGGTSVLGPKSAVFVRSARHKSSLHAIYRDSLTIRSGGKDLKASGHYPAAYGLRVAQLHLEWMVP